MAVPPAVDERSAVSASDDEPTSHDHPASAADTGAGAGARSAVFRLVLLGVLVVALLASAGTLIWLLAGRQGDGADEQQQRDAVMSQAQQFMLRLNTYGPDDLDSKGEMPGYRKSVSEVITPKFRSSFLNGVVAAEQTVAKAKVSRTAKVYAVAVSSIDPDSATALVAGSFTNSYPNAQGTAVPDEPAPFRIEVKLVKISGRWLVDDFTPVTGATR